MSTHQPEPGSRKQELFLEAVEIERMVGTSFAAPLVSGVCALMAPLRPDLTQVDARPFLGAGADDQAGGLGDPQGFDPQHGRERVNAFHSLRLATTQIDVVHRSATGLELSWPSPPSAANIAPWQVYRLAPACDRDSDRWHGNAHRFLCRQFQPPLLPGGFPTVIVHSSLPPLIVCLATAIAGTRGTWEIDAALRTGAPRN